MTGHNNVLLFRLYFYTDNNTVINEESNDLWQSVKTRKPIKFKDNIDIYSFTILIENSTETENKWKFITGVAPESFHIGRDDNQFIGGQGSIGYSGNGSIYYERKKNKYGDKYGKTGDVIKCIIHKRDKTIEFIKNGLSQGVYKNFDFIANIYPCVSMTGSLSKIKFVEYITRESSGEMIYEDVDSYNVEIDNKSKCLLLGIPRHENIYNFKNYIKNKDVILNKLITINNKN